MHKHLSLKVKNFKPSSESEDTSGDKVCPVTKGICVLSLMGFFMAFSCAARSLACCFILSSNPFVRSLMFLLYREPLAFFRCVSEFKLKQLWNFLFWKCIITLHTGWRFCTLWSDSVGRNFRSDLCRTDLWRIFASGYSY